MTRWYVYILRCGDGTLYTGIATDVRRRLTEHREGAGAKYTRGRSPLQLIFQKRVKSRSAALQRESAIKRLRRPQKLLLARNN